MDSQFDSILLSARGKSDREMQTAVFAVFFKTSPELALSLEGRDFKLRNKNFI